MDVAALTCRLTAAAPPKLKCSFAHDEYHEQSLLTAWKDTYAQRGQCVRQCAAHCSTERTLMASAFHEPCSPASQSPASVVMPQCPLVALIAPNPVPCIVNILRRVGLACRLAKNA